MKKKLAVLLTNTGTPDAPTPDAVKRYLREFLSDKRVVHLPRLLWLPLLNGLILPLRAKKSAALYEHIWTTDSPMRIHMRALADRLSAIMNTDECEAVVSVGMNYGNPSIASALQALLSSSPDEIIILPLYPQFSYSTTASSFDRVDASLKKQASLPTIRKIKSYATHPAYIQALASHLEHHWETHGHSEHLLISYHGIPERFVKEGDPYQQECEATTRALVHALNLKDGDYTHCYQSKFGYAAWLTPSTQDLFLTLPQKGIRSIDVVCPGFSVDCLETLDEIAIVGRDDFIKAGGIKLTYIPALNETTAHALAVDSVLDREA